VLTRVAYGHPLSLSPSVCLSVCMSLCRSSCFCASRRIPVERRTVHYHAAAYISPRQLLCRKGGFSVLLREESGRWSVLSIYLSIYPSVCLSVYFSSYIGESHEQKGGRGLRRAFLCWLAGSLSIETEFDSICCRAVSRVCRKHYAGCIFSLSLLTPHSHSLPGRSFGRLVGLDKQSKAEQGTRFKDAAHARQIQCRISQAPRAGASRSAVSTVPSGSCLRERKKRSLFLFPSFFLSFFLPLHTRDGTRESAG
jgi:hypothetical protein